MLLSINWLKDFVKLPKNISAVEIGDKLTAHTVEVEHIIAQKDIFDKVVVGKVLKVEPHPNADRLRLVKVDVKSAILDIVCGAPNVAVGQMVPVALVGAKLPNGLEIKESAIRGAKSSGMICAEDELGLGRNHEGIMVLNHAKLGQDFAAYLNSNDTILEIDNKSLSNRSDLWGQYGLAREVATIFDLKLKAYADFIDQDLIFTGEEKLSVKVEEEKLCPRYLALKISNLKVTESPAWLKERLIAVGLKPINNLVDLTNYVMWELGQPLHAFSADGIDKILVRRAKRNEVISTLDEIERPLSENMLLITDGKKPLAIAGVMGGLTSGINEKTTSLILEAANFEPVSIRKTANALGLRTEASMRFEKGLDPNLTDLALKRFVTLLKKLCPEMIIASNLMVESKFDLNLGPVVFSYDWVSRRLGEKLDKKKIIHILEKLGFTVSLVHNEFSVMIPTWRAAKDVADKEDILEEIVRIYGYDNIKSVLPVLQLSPTPINTESILERKIQDLLALENHLNETYNYSFVNEAQLKKINLEFSGHLKLVNPISETHTLLKQNLIVGLLNNVKTNQFNYEDIGLFEIGRVFKDLSGTINKDLGEEFLPYQDKYLGLIWASNKTEAFSYLKGLVTNLIHGLLSDKIDVVFTPIETAPAWADEQLAAKININNREVGVIAQLNKVSADNFGLKKVCVLAELEWRELHDLFISQGDKKYFEPVKYPALGRDLAFLVSQKLLYNEIRTEIKNFNPLIKEVELFDIYSGSKIASSLKSLAFHLVYQSEERTLTATEVDDIQNGLIAHLADKFAAKLRDF
ncbi:MAG: phenylalanine--tRNA ligase subunit beta [Candidatus Falkowbacteria bacterium]|nr:phenylalanine--tRNA ligase subunit beta [Candidatus Falkowbacteria bacterium]